MLSISGAILKRTIGHRHNRKDEKGKASDIVVKKMVNVFVNVSGLISGTASRAF